MKHFKNCIATILALGLFCSCSSNSPSPNSGSVYDLPASTEPTATEQQPPLYMTTKFNPEGSGNQNGYYYVAPREDGSQNIMYLDYATKQQMFLCNRPECMHDTESCTSWLPYAGGSVVPVPIEDKVYLVFYGGDLYAYETFGDIALSHIDAMDLNGANRKTLSVIDTKNTLGGQSATDGKNLYVLIESIAGETEEEYRLSQDLVRIELATGRVNTLCTLPDTEAFLVGTTGNQLIIKSMLTVGSSQSTPIYLLFDFGTRWDTYRN